jgi:hypothetical protein
VPDGNEYLGVGVFAWDLDPTANIDISLSLNSELISESTNPAGLDDFLEAQEGVTAGDYTVTVKVGTTLIVCTCCYATYVQHQAAPRMLRSIHCQC